MLFFCKVMVNIQYKQQLLKNIFNKAWKLAIFISIIIHAKNGYFCILYQKLNQFGSLEIIDSSQQF